MPPRKKKQLWEIVQERRKVGRPVKFETPEQMAEAAAAYFKWVQDNPLKEAKLSQGRVHSLNKMQAMTLGGMCLHMGITFQTYKNYQANERFFDVCAEIEEVIKHQKYVGAAAGLLNPAIIARDLGLVDKTENTQKHEINVIEKFEGDNDEQ